MSEFKNTAHIEGIVIEIKDEESFPSGFSKRTIAVEGSNNPKYPSKIAVEFIKNKAELLSGLQIGDCVSIDGFVNGREWNGKYFMSINAQTLTRTNERNESAPVPRQEESKSESVDDGQELPF